MSSIRPVLALILPLAALTACSGEPEVAAPEGPDTNVVEELPGEPSPLAEPEPSPTPSPTPTFEAAPKPAPLDEDAQMQEDADAVGMTARVNRGEDRDNAPEDLLPPAQPADKQ